MPGDTMSVRRAFYFCRTVCSTPISSAGTESPSPSHVPRSLQGLMGRACTLITGMHIHTRGSQWRTNYEHQRTGRTLR